MKGLRIQVWRDTHGDLRAAWQKPPPHGEWLVRLLEGDLAGDVVYCEELLHQARAIAAGESAAYRASGNAFCIALSGTQAALYPHHDDEAAPFRVPLREFVRLLECWRRLISG